MQCSAPARIARGCSAQGGEAGAAGGHAGGRGELSVAARLSAPTASVLLASVSIWMRRPTGSNRLHSPCTPIFVGESSRPRTNGAWWAASPPAAHQAKTVRESTVSEDASSRVRQVTDSQPARPVSQLLGHRGQEKRLATPLVYL